MKSTALFIVLLQARLVDGKGVPIPNELIFIQADKANYHSNTTTHEHGLVQFSINTTNVTDPSLTVTVSLEQRFNKQGEELVTEMQPNSA